MLLSELLYEKYDRPLTKAELDKLEHYLDSIYARDNINFEFTRHFIDRVNDERNRKQITFNELLRVFGKAEQKYGSSIAELGDQAQAVIRDADTHINSPFVLVWNKQTKMFDLIAKTVMRKQHFKTTNRVLEV